MNAFGAHQQCSRRYHHALVFGVLFAFICMNRYANDLECFKFSPVGNRRLTEESAPVDDGDIPRDYLATWNDVEKFHKGAPETRKPSTRVPFHPVFWHHAKSGGTTLERLLSSCFKLITASSHDGGQPTELKILPYSFGRFVSVDLSKDSGIDRAVQLDFPHHLNMSDVIVSTKLHVLIPKLLSPEENGFFFTLFRHPVERAVSTFYYLQVADWEGTYKPEWKNLTLKEHVHAGGYRANWVMHHLLGDEHELNNESITLAKDILRQNFVIGLTDRAEESVRRFARVFAWDVDSHRSCFDDLVKHPQNENKHQGLDPSSAEWRMLEEIHSFDMELYNYAVELFHEQGDKWFGSGGLLSLPTGEQNRNEPVGRTDNEDVVAAGTDDITSSQPSLSKFVNRGEDNETIATEGNGNVTGAKAANKEVVRRDDSGEDIGGMMGLEGSKAVPGNESMGRSQPNSILAKDLAHARDIEGEAGSLRLFRMETWISLVILLILFISFVTGIRRKGQCSAFRASAVDTARATTEKAKRRLQRPCATWRGQPLVSHR